MLTLNSRVKCLYSCDGKSSIQFESGRIIYIGKRCLVEFDSNVCGHDGNGIGKNRHCWMIDSNKLEPIN